MDILALLRELFYRAQYSSPERAVSDRLAGGGHVVSIRVAQDITAPEQAASEQPPVQPVIQTRLDEGPQQDQMTFSALIPAQRLRLTRSATSCSSAARLGYSRKRPR